MIITIKNQAKYHVLLTYHYIHKHLGFSTIETDQWVESISNMTGDASTNIFMGIMEEAIKIKERGRVKEDLSIGF